MTRSTVIRRAEGVVAFGLIALFAASAHGFPPPDFLRVRPQMGGDVYTEEVREFHDSPQHQQDMQPPYLGPGFEAGAGGQPPIPFPAMGVRLLAWFTVPSFNPSFTSANTCWGYVSPSGREYAIIGLSGSTAFVEVTDPGAPVVVMQIAGPTSLWRDMKVFEHYCYAVSEGGGGIQVMDMSQIDNGIVTLANTVTTGGLTATHTVHINEESGYLYRCGGQGGSPQGIRIYNLNASRTNPPFVGQWQTRYVHECQVLNWTTGPFAGREICFAYGNDSGGGGNPRLNILDVTNKSAITQISQVGWPNGSFSHQGWVSADRRHVYINDELDEANFNIFTLTRIVNIENLASPIFVGGFDNGLNNIDHNLYTKGNLIFESNYRAGLRIYDATNPTAPVEIAYFDTYPQDDNPNFNGLWNNYPYLPSGTIIGSDIEKGLFVWRMGPPELVFSFPDGRPSMTPTSGGTFKVKITPAEGQSVQDGTPVLFVTEGGMTQQVPLTPLMGDEYLASIPPLACGSEVRYYIQARTSAGLTAREPSTAPSATFSLTVGTSFEVVVTDQFETNTGWTVGGPSDTASSGIWVRAEPVGTSAQPETDNTPDPGAICWVTGNGAPGGSVGAADVDGGITTLTSPVFSAVAQPGLAVVSYARWYSNDQGAEPNSDFMPIEISNNGGTSWVLVESVTENARAWVTKTFRVSDFVTPTSNMRLRFVARDDSPPSVVEAGVDDFKVSYIDCEPPNDCIGDADGDGDRDFGDIGIILANFGVMGGSGSDPGDSDGDGDVDFADIGITLANFGATCP